MRKSGTTPHLRIKFTLLTLWVSLGVSLFKTIPYRQDILQWTLLLVTIIPAGILWISMMREMELSLSFPLVSMILVLIPLWDHFLTGTKLSPMLGPAAILILSGLVLLENPYQDEEELF